MLEPRKVYLRKPPESTLDYVLAYLRVGLGLLPAHGVTNGRCTCGEDCGKDAGKHPLANLVPSGVKNATTDEATIRWWLARRSHWNIAVACGSVSGIVVVDADGEVGLAELECRGYPMTWSVQSGSGGLHVYLKHPGHPVGNWKIPGIGELRADGGYVIAPPSRHRSGGRYEWLPGLSPWEVDLAPAPDWVPLESPQETQRVIRPTGVALAPKLSRLSKRMQDLVRYGNRGEYESRSEADMAACVAMFGAGYSVAEVWTAMTDSTNGISQKYREKGRQGERYLGLTISKAWVVAKPGRARVCVKPPKSDPARRQKVVIRVG